MSLEGMMLSEIHQREMQILLVSLTCGSKKPNTQKPKQNRKRPTGTENKVMGAGGAGVGGTEKKVKRSKRHTLPAIK